MRGSNFTPRHQGQMLMRRFVCLLILGLVLAACTTNLAVLPNATPPPATAQPNFVVPSDTPFVMPTPPLTATPVCSAAPPNRLILHQRGRVLPDDPRPIKRCSSIQVRSLNGC